MRKKFYHKLRSHRGIYKHKNNGKYLVIKRVNYEKFSKTFTSLQEARHWQKHFSGDKEKKVKYVSDIATLNEVWVQMKQDHFPSLAESTKAIWTRRYQLLKDIEHLPMDLITPSVITSWVQRQVKYFKSDKYEQNCRGKAKRCNLDNELNLFTTIFNWYKQSEVFEHECVHLTNPIKTKHKKLGFIRPKPIKDKKITLDDALEFFNHLPLLYQDLARLQYFLASRISEVVGLQWHRIDFKNRRVTIMETACFNQGNKTFSHLNPHPKNKESRQAYMTDEIHDILLRRIQDKIDGNEFVFHINGRPLNYCTIQSNYKKAIKKADLPYSGTHILRHGMATLARKVGGGLDAVIAMTGHKDFKLADHYSKLDLEYQKEVSEKIMEVMRDKKEKQTQSFENVIQVDFRK